MPFEKENIEEQNENFIRAAFVKAIYALKCGEHIKFNNEYYTRVPGGWTYENQIGNLVFIPYSEEFKPV